MGVVTGVYVIRKTRQILRDPKRVIIVHEYKEDKDRKENDPDQPVDTGHESG